MTIRAPTLVLLLFLLPLIAWAQPQSELKPVETPPQEDTEAYDYPDKPLWHDGTVYGGHMDAARIVAGNGSPGFDIDSFIDSEMGERILSMIKNELVIYGGQNWNHPDMIRYWQDRGVIREIHDIEDPQHTWISYVPDYMLAEGNQDRYPVVFSAHGGGSTLWEAENHGFAALAHDMGFIVVAPENENSNPQVSVDRLGPTLDEMEKLGYPVDRSRVYYTGMSAGGVASLYVGLKATGQIAAIAAHSSPAPLDSASERFAGLITDDMFDAGTQVPMWLAVGEYDFGQLPLSAGTIDGLNAWLAMNGCGRTAATPDNLLGITADSITVKKFYGVDYTFVDFSNAQGVTMNEIVGVQGHPHWVTPNFAELAWAFMSKFSRSAGGALVVSEE